MPGCQKNTNLLVNVSLKFQMLIPQICQHFLLKTFEKLFAVQKLLLFFQQKISEFLSSPLAGKRDIVVTILVWCMCLCLCVHPAITGTFMHGFQNNFAQLLFSRKRHLFT